MESRFRKFLTIRREQAPRPVQEPDLQGISYAEVSKDERQPIFIYQSLETGSIDGQNEVAGEGLPLPALSYESATAGRAPIFGGRPHRGNGPVKLQTSRRLSSGDLFVTTQDSERTLQDIREGEYIVGKKDKRLSQSLGQGEGALRNSRVSTAVSCPPTSYRYSTRAFTPPDSKLARNSTSTNQYESKSNTRGVHSVASLPRMSTASQEGWTSRFLPLDGNATIQALRKAEYSRLVKLYGQDGVDRNIAILDKDHLNPNQNSSVPLPSKQTPLVLEPLPKPPESKTSDSRPTSELSVGSDHGFDSSDWSSNRQPSMSSSYEDSTPQTSHTSVQEHDSTTTRDDIRRMVDQLRSTYISALDSCPTTSKPKKSKSKKRRTLKLKESPALPSTSTDAAHSPSTRNEDTQTLHSDENARHSLSKRRASQPTSANGRLSPIQASPSRERKPVEEDAPMKSLKRADSATLGSMFLESKSSSEEKKKNRQSSSTKSTKSTRRTTASSDRPITPSPSSAPQSNWFFLDFDSTDDGYLDVSSKPPPVPAFPDLMRYQSSPRSSDRGSEHHSTYPDMFCSSPVDVALPSPLHHYAGQSLHPPAPTGPPPPLPMVRQHS